MNKTIALILLTTIMSWCFSEKLRLNISSPNFSNNWFIPEEHSCIWSDMNPELRFTNIPLETQSLVLIMDDTDAPWWEWLHWLMWNILPTTENIEANQQPMQSVTWLNSWWEDRYWWPCPPSGTHSYNFKLYALNTILKLEKNSSKQQVLEAMSWSILDETVLIGKYRKGG